MKANTMFAMANITGVSPLFNCGELFSCRDEQLDYPEVGSAFVNLDQGANTPMSLAKRIQKARTTAGFTLDQLAERAGISKTYLWELENDAKGEKKPSADILLRIATALSTSIADLLALPSVRVDESKIDLPPSLIEFRDWMKKVVKEPLSDEDLRDLAVMRFRGGQPRTRDDWNDLYRLMKRASKEE